jgi:hypothetical protein
MIRDMNSGKIPKRRLTRAQVGEALQTMPMQSILMGAQKGGERTLTTKQLRFAEALAMGDTKAGAYRKAYDTKAKPQVQSLEGQRLAASPAVALQIDAFKLALEAQRYATPAALRALVIERLTAAAINPGHAPAQQLRALELLGKVTEVAAFTERREIIKSDSPADARERLLTSLRAAISAGDQGASLLAELARRPAVIIDADADAVLEPDPAPTDLAIGEAAPPPTPTRARRLPENPAGGHRADGLNSWQARAKVFEHH